MRRRRKRPVLRWTATIVAVLVLAFTVATFWYDFRYGSLRWFVGVCGGQIHVVHVDDAYFLWDGHPVTVGAPMGAHVEPARPLPKNYTPAWSLWPGWDSFPDTRGVYVPLWPFVLVPALMAGWRWWRDWPRPGPGQCRRCGYDLTGNVSGRCPECGVAA